MDRRRPRGRRRRCPRHHPGRERLAHHDHEQRLARWILICADRADEEVIHLSQEFIACFRGKTFETYRPSIPTKTGNTKGEFLARRRNLPFLSGQASDGD